MKSCVNIRFVYLGTPFRRSRGRSESHSPYLGILGMRGITSDGLEIFEIPAVLIRLVELLCTITLLKYPMLPRTGHSYTNKNSEKV